ncbi:MAG: MBL fold metallo-hydrolase [Firmicutes bacterium]|nr:MBL fold metallo-hydrolase [Bacillota bacterium]
MKITALLENTACDERLGCEHGLSLYVELKDKVILFDAGASGLFAENAEKLGKDLSKVDLAILSHGHNDHSGGLSRFIELNDHAPIYINKHAFEPHYNAAGKFIGMDLSLLDSGRVILTEDEARLGEGLTLYSCNGFEKHHDVGNFGMSAVIGGKTVPEDFRHEQYLLIEEDGKRVLLSGCSHKGVMDIADWFKPDVLIGGFHFEKLPIDDTMKGYAEFLNSLPTEFYTCHCTGAAQYEFMQQYMDRLHYLSGGMTIEL